MGSCLLFAQHKQTISHNFQCLCQVGYVYIKFVSLTGTVQKTQRYIAYKPFQVCIPSADL